MASIFLVLYLNINRPSHWSPDCDNFELIMLLSIWCKVQLGRYLVSSRSPDQNRTKGYRVNKIKSDH